MRTNAIFLLFTTAFSLSLMGISRCDPSSFDAQAEASKSLAVKLYPDCTAASSKLVGLMLEMDSTLKTRNSELYNLPIKPLILASECASMLEIQPRWFALTESEKATAYDEIIKGLLFTMDLAAASSKITTPVTEDAQIAALRAQLSSYQAAYRNAVIANQKWEAYSKQVERYARATDALLANDNDYIESLKAGNAALAAPPAPRSYVVSGIHGGIGTATVDSDGRTVLQTTDGNVITATPEQ